MEKLIEQLIELTKEKNLPKKDIQIALTLFLTSATMQAKELTQKPVDEIALDSTEFEMIQSKLNSVTSPEELEEITQQIDAIMSKQGTSFQNEFDRIFEALIRDFIDKIK